jgi:phospholipase/carboxylesterase
MAELSFIHQYVRPANSSAGVTPLTLLALHGTGGDEHDLLPLGRALLPGAGILSPRGRVLENGMPRFFRRLAEGVFDQQDLATRTDELAAFIDEAAAAYGLDRDRVVAVGFSNGANIAASLLLKRGAVLHGAVLLSPMVPFEPKELPDLRGVRVFLGAGRRDPIVPASQVELLGALLESSGAQVTTHWHNGGHSITNDELEAAQRWIRSF